MISIPAAISERRVGSALSRFSIVNASISKTLSKIQKSVVDIFTRSASQGNRRKPEMTLASFSLGPSVPFIVLLHHPIKD
jgi:hypothetical protein